MKQFKYYESCNNLNGKEKKICIEQYWKYLLKKIDQKYQLNIFLDAFKIDQNDKIIINNLLSNYIELRYKKFRFLYIKSKNHRS